MRKLLLTSALLLAGAFATPAHADPYKWCAIYSGKHSATNCYFVTLAQCRAALYGGAGFCTPNNFYDGRPVVTPEERRRRGVAPRGASDAHGLSPPPLAGEGVLMRT